MLIQFNFKNFKSFRDETILDLSATKITEFSERVRTISQEKILPVAAIYGSNASGKSNVYQAFEYMSHYVVDSFMYGNEEKFSSIKPSPFLFDAESEQVDTSFEVYFTIPGDPTEKCYNYGFCVGPLGITEEWLNRKAKTAKDYRTIFYRDCDSQDLSGLPKNCHKNIEVALEKEVLIVSLGAKLKIEICKIIRDWFYNNEFANFGDVVTNLLLARALPVGFVDSDEVRNNVVKFLSSFDKSIKGFEVIKLPPTDGKEENRYSIQALHYKAGTKQMAKIPLSEESAGTLKMFAMYQLLQQVLENGGVFFIDELNARLHPLLVRNVLITFLNPEINKHDAQLIFTTHDTWQLSNLLLRRDEIWFVNKDEEGVSSLYSLSDFKTEENMQIRKDESYEKNYLLGKYGAIPELQNITF